MPLKDHNRLDPIDQWSGFHSMWAAHIVGRLNSAVLSKRYKARPSVHLGTRAEIDIGAFEHPEAASPFAGAATGGVAVATAPAYAPPAPALSAGIEFVEPEAFEVQVFGDRNGWQLVAAIELVSPANKDRPESRAVFAAKCATYLAAGVAVVVVDAVTERRADPHLELCDLLDLPDAFRWESPTGLSAVAYRTVQGIDNPRLAVGNGRVRLDVWPRPLTVGSELPTLPLWLAADLAVPLELELTYEAACQALGLGP